MVSHAYSDGFCSVPLVQDLAALYSQEEELHLGRPSGARLLPLPRGAAFEDLEQRLFAAFEAQQGSCSHPEQLSFRSAIFDSVPNRLPWVYTHEVLVEGNAVGLLRRCAQMCPPCSGSPQRFAECRPCRSGSLERKKPPIRYDGT